jgi:hypothetical protein
VSGSRFLYYFRVFVQSIEYLLVDAVAGLVLCSTRFAIGT